MLRNFFKITLRTLFRNKVYSFINIFGLAVGVACFLLIGLFVADELTYDSFNKNASSIFRINTNVKVGENRFNLANSPIPLAEVLQSEYPEIRKSVRIFPGGNVYIKKGEDYLQEEKFLYADSSFFDVFTAEFVLGQSRTALKEPGSIVITTTAAEKYFGRKNPLGETLILSGGTQFIVKGVVNPYPTNSSFEFDFLASFSTLPESRGTDWFNTMVHTFVLTDKGVTAKQLNSKIFAIIEKHVGPLITAGFGVSYKDFLASGNDYSMVFVNLQDLHLFSYNVFNELKPSGDINTVYMFSAIALFILVIACINFVNLATAKSTKRANEVGVRKVLGSDKALLIKQFLSESIMLALMSVTLSLMIIEIALPWFNELTGKQLFMNYFGNYFVIPGLILFTIVLGAAAGLYPALVLASFKPVLVLKGKVFRGTSKNYLRKGLIVFQFATSIILFTGTLVIYQQMEYIRNKNLGFNKDQVLIIHNIRDLGEQQFTFARSIKNNPAIINASLSQGLPLYSLNAGMFKLEGSNDNQTIINLQVDYNFLDTYEIKMKEGRFFEREMSSDTMAIIVNESGVKKLGITDPLNKRILSVSSDTPDAPAYSIIGVAKDFHLQTMKDEIRPSSMVILKNPEANFLSVKISPRHVEETIKYLKQQWKEFGQEKSLQYTFFDEQFTDIYRSELRTGTVFTIFAVLAIVIACLGLFGLAAFTAEQRTKEIGMRKVLGSSVTQIAVLLSKEFIKWVVISNLIAWPAAYYIMNRWLQEFVYRIDIHFTVFLLSGFSALAIAVLTISYQAIKAALSDPVKSLKYE